MILPLSVGWHQMNTPGEKGHGHPSACREAVRLDQVKRGGCKQGRPGRTVDKDRERHGFPKTHRLTHRCIDAILRSGLSVRHIE